MPILCEDTNIIVWMHDFYCYWLKALNWIETLGHKITLGYYTKVILLNNLSFKYNNVILALGYFPSQRLEDMVVPLLAEEKITIVGYAVILNVRWIYTKETIIKDQLKARGR